ncbi:MAG: NAD-dependent epimerase/dehydratase family protein [Actinomycetota bacterium]|nr:NAD-dependent epimerase/dehydratase family protein [Actinomycetota bacterium]
MRVVVVGASGNVGTSVLQSLAEEPAVQSVLGLVRRVPRWSVAKTEWATADIATDDLVPHFQDADVVVHLAWLFQPTHDTVTTWRANALGSIRVFRAVADAGVPALVYASSVGAYSPGPQDRRVDESWPTHGWPTAGYTRENAYVERVLDVLERDDPKRRVVRLRPGFIFKRESAVEQRRLFAGPFVPHQLVRPGLIPVVPDVPGLQFQALHASDAGEAYRLAVVRPVRGAFNIAADPVIDGPRLAELLGAKRVRVPAAVVRTAVVAAWHLHLVPASPQLLDAVLRLPLMDTTRARTELGWSPRHSAVDAVREFLEGFRSGSGMSTPPLAPETSGRMREHEIRTGVGEKP